jgi:hypothetical protein
MVNVVRTSQVRAFLTIKPYDNTTVSVAFDTLDFLLKKLRRSQL